MYYRNVSNSVLGPKRSRCSLLHYLPFMAQFLWRIYFSVSNFFMEKGAQSIAWLGTILHLCINWNKECSRCQKRPQDTIIQSRQNTCPHLQIRINYSCEEKKELSSCPLLPKGSRLNIKRNTILLHLHSYILFYKKVQQLVATSIYLTACSTIPLKCFHICQAPLEKNAGIIAGAAI